MFCTGFFSVTGAASTSGRAASPGVSATKRRMQGSARFRTDVAVDL